MLLKCTAGVKSVKYIHFLYFAFLFFFLPLTPLSITYLPSVDTVSRFTPVAERQQSKDVSSFSSSTTSPWDSPENTSQGLRPELVRAQSAPITQPTEPIDPIKSPTAASPPKTPKSVDSFSSVSWSQSQWIAFGDRSAPPCRHGSGSSVAEVQKAPAGGFGRASRFLSDESADAFCKAAATAVREDSSVCFADVFSDRTVAAATACKVFHGNSYVAVQDTPCAWGFGVDFAWKLTVTSLVFHLFFVALVVFADAFVFRLPEMQDLFIFIFFVVQLISECVLSILFYY